MALVFYNGLPLFVGGEIAMGAACCCGGTSVCACCPHAVTWCSNGCKMDVTISGAIAGTGTMSPRPFACPTFDDNGITLTANCSGFSLTMYIECCGGVNCFCATFAWVNPLAPNDCAIVPDTSRGAQSDGWFSFKCDPFKLVYHLKTSGANCSCGDGQAITVTIEEKPTCT